MQQIASKFERGKKIFFFFLGLVKLHLWLEKHCGRLWISRKVPSMACYAGHENNTKTFLSAALFLLPETTNSRETRVQGRKEWVLPGEAFTSCADENIAAKGLLRFSHMSLLCCSKTLVTADPCKGESENTQTCTQGQSAWVTVSIPHEQTCNIADLQFSSHWDLPC